MTADTHEELCLSGNDAGKASRSGWVGSLRAALARADSPSLVQVSSRNNCRHFQSGNFTMDDFFSHLSKSIDEGIGK